MHRLAITVALIILLPGAMARAAPISLEMASASGGFTAGTASDGWFALDLGVIDMPSALSTGSFLIGGLSGGSDYTVTFTLAGVTALSALRAEILDPLDADDRQDMTQPAYVPLGYSTSNDVDGFSFAQGSGLARSAAFAGGAAAVTADELTHRGDVLLFTGLPRSQHAQVTFGLRDRIGGRSFLLRLSGDTPTEAATAPEPASMLLIGTGLAGLVAVRRRRRTAAHK